MSWQEFLSASDADMRRNDITRGLSYSPDPKGLTIDVVADYVDGFGAYGVGAREVIQAVQRDERGVKRALTSLVERGDLRVEETLTRGPKASKRKVYRPTENKGPVIVSSEPLYLDYYGSPRERQDSEHGAGGGHAVLPTNTETRFHRTH